MFNKIFKRKQDDEQNIASLIKDARACLTNDYFDDAVTIINNALLQEGKTVDNSVALYSMLGEVYEKQGNQNMANTVRRDFLAFLDKEAPNHKEIRLPVMLALFKAEQLTPDKDEINTLATLALQQQDYKTAIKVVGQFSKKYPDHPDFVSNYLIVGKALTAGGEAEKAYRLLGGLLKKYPNHPQARKVKVAALMAKDQMEQKGNTTFSR